MPLYDVAHVQGRNLIIRNFSALEIQAHSFLTQMRTTKPTFAVRFCYQDH